jgi:hypothetical protein
MIDIFLRGDDEFILDYPEFEGLSEYAVPTDEAIHQIRNLAYYDGVIQYDGYVALARYAADKDPGTPLTFITNQSPKFITANILDMGLVAENADSISMQTYGSGEEFDTVYKRITQIITQKTHKTQIIGQTYIVSVTSNDKLVTNNKLFQSVEAWVSGSVLNPFSEIVEADSCERYKRLLFYDTEEMKSWFKSRFTEKEYIRHSIDKIWLYGNGTYNGFPRVKDPGNLIDLVEAKVNEESVEYQYIYSSAMVRLMEKFKNWNYGDPSKRTRVGGGPKIIINNKTKKRNYDNDTDPILTVIAMMFTFCFIPPNLNKLPVLVVTHGYIDGRVESYNIVPKDTVIRTVFPGHRAATLIYNIIMRPKYFESKYKTMGIKYTTDSKGDYGQILNYTTGKLYRNVLSGKRIMLISLFENGNENPHVVLWSMLIVDKMFKFTESRSENKKLKSLISLGEFVRFVKEGLFWYKEHEIEWVSCQVVGDPKTLINKVLTPYWAHIKTTILSINNIEPDRLKGIKTEDQFKELLIEVYTFMPRHMKDDVIRLKGEYDISPLNPAVTEVTVYDVLSFAKERFVNLYLNIDVKKLMKEKPQTITDRKYEDNERYFNNIMELVTENVKFDKIFDIYAESSEHTLYEGEVVKYENFGTGLVSKKDILEGIYKKFGMNEVADLSMYEVRTRKGVDSSKTGHVSSTGLIRPGGSAYAGQFSTVAAIAASIFLLAASTIAGTLHSYN